MRRRPAVEGSQGRTALGWTSTLEAGSVNRPCPHVRKCICRSGASSPGLRAASPHPHLWLVQLAGIASRQLAEHSACGGKALVQRREAQQQAVEVDGGTGLAACRFDLMTGVRLAHARSVHCIAAVGDCLATQQPHAAQQANRTFPPASQSIMQASTARLDHIC